MNKYNCPVKIWKKFSDAEKKRYNQIRESFQWDALYHVDIISHDKAEEMVDVTAHNMACIIIWNNL